jgi:NAD(P)H-nitrite reductase large subunit
MIPDQTICYCYQVSQQKLVHFARRVRPAKASQMSECLGAGTGCGWCIPVLKLIQAAVAEGRDCNLPVSEQDYEAGRAEYLRAGEGKNRF